MYSDLNDAIMQLFGNYGGLFTSHNVTGTRGGRDRQNPDNTGGGD